MSDTLYDLFQSNFPADRARPFLEVPGDRTWSYADLEEETTRLEACGGARRGGQVRSRRPMWALQIPAYRSH